MTKPVKEFETSLKGLMEAGLVCVTKGRRYYRPDAPPKCLRTPLNAENLRAMAGIVNLQLQDSYGEDAAHIKLLALCVVNMAMTLAEHLEVKKDRPSARAGHLKYMDTRTIQWANSSGALETWHLSACCVGKAYGGADTYSIENHGPLITASNFWEPPEGYEDKFFLKSERRGLFGFLVPRSRSRQSARWPRRGE